MTGGELESSELGCSIGSESGTEVGYSIEMTGGELEVSDLGESSTQVGSSSEMSGGNGDGKIEGYLLGKKMFVSECRTKAVTSVGRSYGKVGYFVEN